MTLPVWSASVPHAPLMSGVSVMQHQSDPIANDMQLGVARLRRVSASQISKLAYAIAMTKTQYLAFKAWFNDDIAGVSRFTMDVWNGSVLVNRTCWIDGGKVEAAPLGQGWRVSFVLCVIDL